MSSPVHDFSALEAQAESIVKKYPQPRSAVLPLLHLVQENDRHVSGEAIKWIAAKLGLQPINVWELVTFYPSFKEQPMGKIHIRVCKTLSCMLAGAERTGEKICQLTGNEMSNTRQDGAVSIEWVECLACCDKAPVVMVNNKLHTNVTEDKVERFVSELNLPQVAKA